MKNTLMFLALVLSSLAMPAAAFAEVTCATWANDGYTCQKWNSDGSCATWANDGYNCQKWDNGLPWPIKK